MIELEEEIKEVVSATTPASIKVIGVGGAGGNTVNSLVDSQCTYIESIAINTDEQALNLSRADKIVQIGIKSTKGLGTGANPDLGKRSAEEDLDKILSVVTDTDIVFLTGGMGGGTGSGALPVIARMLRENNILSIALVTLPFDFEGKRRRQLAEDAVELVKQEVDTLIVVPNQKLLHLIDKHVSMLDAFAMINDILVQSVRGITDIITKPGHINVDFADVRTIMKDRGLAVMGSASASGENRAEEATLKAITSPLLENISIKGAQGVLLNITGGKDLSLHEISQAASIVYEEAALDADIILGSVINEEMQDEVNITIIATGFESEENKVPDIHAALTMRNQREKEEPVCLDNCKEEQIVRMKESSGQAENQSAVQLDSEKEMKEPEEGKIKLDTKKSTALLDVHDLDVPTFLRKERQDKSLL